MGLLGDLLVSPVPEPIADEAWRRAARILAIIHAVLLSLNLVSGLLMAPLDPEVHMPAVRQFLWVNIPANLFAIVIHTWVYKGAQTQRQLRAGTLFAAGVAILTVLSGLWLNGSVSSWNCVWLVIMIVGYRIYFDASVGRWVLGLALIEYASLIALELTGVLASHAIAPQLVTSQYQSPAHHLMTALWIGIAFIVCHAVATYAAVRIRITEHAMRELNRTLEERVREQIGALERANRLRRYLSPQVAERLLVSAVDPVAVRERRPITVMFADLKSFTPMVERLPPEALSLVLTRYFTEVAGIAFRHGGTIDKFIGDAVMVFFGAPEATGDSDQAIRCVRMALEVQRRIGELGADFVALGAEGALEVRIGIGSGVTTVGEFGAQHRTDYTVVGAPVNRAARLEALAPAGGILIDRATFELVGERAQSTPHGEVTLKGFSKAEPVYLVTSMGKLPTLRDAGRDS